MKKIATAMLLIGMSAGLAQAASDMPTGEVLIEKFLEVTGGVKAHDNVKSSHAVGSFSLPAMGLSASIEVWTEAPNRTYTLIESDTFGTISEGYDGEVAWESNMMSGTKVKEGVEEAVARRGAQASPWSSWKDWYQSATTTGSAAIEGQDCWIVEMLPNEGEGEVEKYYFAKESGLLLKNEMALNSEMGVVNTESYPSDYRKAGELMVPFKLRQILMGMQEMEITFETQEYNVDVPAGTFDLPDEVKALLVESE